MIKYPIGLQDFRAIREGEYLYVDKTAQIHNLMSSGKYYFLSRPRRFGKSLLLSTIKEIYLGSKELFEGLWIFDQKDWNKKQPVIHIKFAKSDYQSQGLGQAIMNELHQSANELGVVLVNNTLKECFAELISLACAKHGKVVLLIDEYDKPIVDYLDELDKAKENRSILKQFYSIIKDSDPYIEFMLLTGVSKFSKVSIFSDLNHLQDLTIGGHYNSLLGITQQELLEYFGWRIKELSIQTPDLPDQLKAWYNGYNWGGKDTLYNPFSLLSYLQSGEFNNYWFETGTPTFLVKLIREEGKYELDEDAFVSLLSLANFDIEAMEFQTILFQTGYLTFSEINFTEGWCKLRYPNKEVKAAFQQMLMAAY